jgi:hypothetical protein
VFTISPRKGFIPSHEEFTFDVTFHPKTESKEPIRFPNVKCNIKDSKAIYVTLIG